MINVCDYNRWNTHFLGTEKRSWLVQPKDWLIYTHLHQDVKSLVTSLSIIKY